MLAQREVRPVYTQPGDYQTPLLQVALQFQREKIVKPVYQRGYVWPGWKAESYIKELVDASRGQATAMPVGVFVTAQVLKNSRGLTEVVDGMQRLTTLLNFLNAPASFYKGMEAEEAEFILDSARVTVQHRLVDTIHEAYRMFTMLNIGTHLTPGEYFAGTLAITPQWGEFAGRIFRDLHTLINTQAGRVVNTNKGTVLTVRRAALRHDYSLAFRWLTHQKELASKHDHIARVAMRDSKPGKPQVEELLAEVLQSTNARAFTST